MPGVWRSRDEGGHGGGAAALAALGGIAAAREGPGETGAEPSGAGGGKGTEGHWDKGQRGWGHQEREERAGLGRSGGSALTPGQGRAGLRGLG